MNRYTCLRLIALLLAVFKSVDSSIENDINKIPNYDDLSPQKLYGEGVKNYLDNHFEGCIYNLEKAIENYNTYMSALQLCRLKCKDEAKNTEPLYQLNLENLLFYEHAIKNTLCLVKCKKLHANIFDSWELEESTIRLFTKRKPYEYLQACYAHNNELQKAADAAFTYLVVNPNVVGVQASFKHYIKQAEVNVDAIINREAKDFVYLYVHGTKAYENKQWPEVVQNMEASLDSFLQSEDECRAQCEGPFDQGWQPDFIPSIANQFTHVLICKRKCNEQLSTLNGEKHDDLLPSHYHYLQYAYFKDGKVKEACQAVASYLLFYPTDKTMLHNTEYYKTLPKVEEDYFKPRSEAMYYVHRHNYEKQILDYVTNVFVVETKKLFETEQNETKTKETDKSESDNKLNKELRGKGRFLLDKPKKKRFAVDNFITNEQCQRLIDIADAYSLPGDGYQAGTSSPHTEHENYLGLSFKKAAYLFKIKEMSLQSIKLLLNVTQKMKSAIEEQFDVTKRLHESFTHLVCRSAKIDNVVNRTDFSHPVHADNCNIEVNGTCPKEWPAFTWRDYTAILYLNEDFAGGELFYAKDYYGKQVEEMIRPKCGRLVGFTSGQENLHGVMAIRRGKRCALAVWLTYDQNHAENEHKQLYNILIPNK